VNLYSNSNYQARLYSSTVYNDFHFGYFMDNKYHTSEGGRRYHNIWKNYRRMRI